jgi:hypothetical protein
MAFTLIHPSLSNGVTAKERYDDEEAAVIWTVLTGRSHCQ